MTTEASRSVVSGFPSRCVFVLSASVRGSSTRLRRSRQEGVFGGGLVHQGLHRDAHLHQALLLQDVVRKTQFVLGGNRRREREGDVEAERRRQQRSI